MRGVLAHRALFAALVSTSLMIGFIGNAAAEVALIDGFGGVRGFGTSCLPPNDDGSSEVIDLTPAFPSGLRFFDSAHTSTYVNTNGNITFSGALWTYTPNPFPVAAQPMIAPYWADVDIRERSGGSSDCTTFTENGVWWHLERGRMVVTWDAVGYFSHHNDLRMSFQLILTESGCGGSGDFDVEFRYNRCEWTTGDASGGSGGFGGTPGQAGFDAGNSTDYVEIPGSRTGTIHTILCTTSNVGEPGIWRYQIRSGQILCPEAGTPCETGSLGVCNEGVTQCTGTDLSGRECMPLLDASNERCDALDNDCDGDIDEGEGLCEAFQVCDRGRCVDPCSEFGCPPGHICGEDGLCVDEACIGIECDPGQRCVGGVCVGACDSVVCPHGQTCLGGRCLDPCELIECDDCSVCEEGACITSCEWMECPGDEVCEEGHCIDSDCEGMSCPAGTFCREGTCVDACDGATCPSGEVCEGGECVPEPDDPIEPDGGPTDPDAGPADSGPSNPDSGPSNPDGGLADADTTSGDEPALSNSSCACRSSIDGSSTVRELLLFGLVAFGLFAISRRFRNGS